MSEVRKNVFGIDFGTTNSVVAVYDLYNKEIQPMLYEDLPHPSIVWYNGEDVVVGREAKRNYNKYIDQAGHSFITSIKSKLGHDDELVVLGEAIPAYEVASKIFYHLKQHTEKNLPAGGMLDEAVVTVPVKFDGLQRADIRRAAQMAGIHVKTFVHEPFAGIVGYLFGEENQNSHKLEGKNILVFDWGGGTLDITVVRYEEGKLFEMGTGGISNKAGDYFDKLIENRITDKFISNMGLNPLAVQIQPRIKDRLMERSESNKIELSDSEEVSFSVPYFFEFDGEVFHLQEDMKRNEFRHLIDPTVSEALREIDLTLEQAGLSYDQIGLALLIGGTSKVPFVVQEIEKLFGSRTYEVENSNTIIAEGASIIAKNEWKPYLVHPICIQLSDNSYYTVFEKGTLLISGGTKKEVTFFITDNRGGEGFLVITEKRNGNQQVVKELLSIPISEKLDKHLVERVTVNFWIDHDLVLNIQAFGQVKNVKVKTFIHDICYGLRIE
ncbi:Hsp70 family protein [Paenibacillus sp. V4I5]|uniref:Hsp70 family protein n=1 Tax=Paenibacillus sp. V4I5 TaxID=3042306 RepID=UPI002792DF41|nr:Hsp70 family protein [Paenibacillus sp. V4I5]MDQ0917555.1 molecular chaperone DnaK [Paenibacillus sp. V4I5]